MKFITSLCQIGVKNLNDRIYTREAVDKMISDFKYTTKKCGAFYGEMGFPETFDITLNKISHNVKDIWLAYNTLLGEIEVLDTPSGRILNKMLEMDPNSLVFRSRSSGAVDTDNTVHINKLYAFDAVPGDENSYSGIMPEYEEIKFERIK